MLIVLSLPLVFWLVLRDKNLRQWFARSSIVRLVGLYILIHLALGLWALKTDRVNSAALVYALGINLRFFGFFLVCLVAAATSSLLVRQWPKIVLWPAAIVIAFGLAQHYLLSDDFLKHFGYGPKTILPYETVDANSRYIRVQSTLRGANPLGAYLVLVVPAGLAMLRHKVVTCILFALAGGVLLFYSYSRSAWLGTAMAAVVLFWLLWQHLPRWWVVSLAALIVLFAGSIYGLRSDQSVQDIFFHTSRSSMSPKSSNVVRGSAIKDALNDVWHQPLGRGPGTAGPASFRNNHSARIAEDYYLQIAQEVGVIGLAIFLSVVLLTAKQLWLLRQGTLAKVLLASLVGISFVNLVSHAWADDTLSLLWWGLAGVACAPAITTAMRRPAHRRSR